MKDIEGHDIFLIMIFSIIGAVLIYGILFAAPKNQEKFNQTMIDLNSTKTCFGLLSFENTYDKSLDDKTEHIIINATKAKAKDLGC